MSGNQATAVRSRIDASRSRFTVQAFAGGLLSVFGHSPVIAVCGFGGDVRFVPGTLEAASLLMLVQSDSLAVVNDVKEKDRLEIERAMREDVLEIARYPEIVFMSTSVSANRDGGDGQYQAKVNGKLSLHGVTRDHSIDARLMVDGGSLRAQGEFSLRQSDYNIKPIAIAGGTLKLRDDLKFSFDIFARES